MEYIQEYSNPTSSNVARAGTVHRKLVTFSLTTGAAGSVVDTRDSREIVPHVPEASPPKGGQFELELEICGCGGSLVAVSSRRAQ